MAYRSLLQDVNTKYFAIMDCCSRQLITYLYCALPFVRYIAMCWILQPAAEKHLRGYPGLL